MWNFDSADLSAIAAGISAFGTLAAAGRRLQVGARQKALQLQNRVYLYESLKVCAERANSSAKDKRGSEWSVNDAADIIRCLVRAMELIKQDSQQKEGNQALMLKQYFVNLLIMELYEEVHNGDAADSVLKVRNLHKYLITYGANGRRL